MTGKYGKKGHNNQQVQAIAVAIAIAIAAAIAKPYNITKTQPCTQSLPKIHLHLHRWNSVRVPPYAHPQHIKVLKHCVCTWYEFGMQSMELRSLNHDLTTSLNITKYQPCTQSLQKNPPPPAQVEQCKGAPICPSTAYKGAKTLFMYMIWMWDAVYGAFEPRPWPYNITKHH